MWGVHLYPMDIPRLGVELEMQLPNYTTATAMPDLSCICNLHHSSRQNARSLTHWERPGIEPASWWILVGFISTELQWELPLYAFLKHKFSNIHKNSKQSLIIPAPHNHPSDLRVIILSYLFIPFLSFFFFLIFRATPKIYGTSQARGRMGATGASLHQTQSQPQSRGI